MAQPSGPKDSGCSGNIFFALFGAIALIGVLGAGVMTFMKGPLATSVKLTRQNTAENQMNIAAQVAVMASASTGDCETVADGFVEPVEWRDPGALGHPTNGGLIPLTIGVSKKDPWGTEYGYCGWDHGPSNSATDAGCGGVGQKRLPGTNGTAYPVVAMISAGPDKVFTTTCRSFAVADANSDGDLEDVGIDSPLVSKAAETDDDLIFTYTYEEATGASGGLWSLKSGDASVATINKDIEVSGTGTFDRIGATGSDYLEMLSGLKLPGPGVMATCNATNAGVMRLNASGTGIEICDGVSAWNEVTGSGGSTSGSDLVLSPVNQTGMDVANGNPTCVSGTCYGSNVTFTLTNNLSPAASSAVLAVTLSNTTDFEKVSDNCNGISLAAAATCQIVVRAKATGNRSYTATLSITGNNSPLATLSGTASGFGCTIGGNGPGGKYAACAIGGYNLIVTPSGCTATTTNPTCAGGADSVTKAGSLTTHYPLKFGSFSGTGVQNTVDEMAYASSSTYVFPGTAWCDALDYGGYSDWFLPSSSEVSAYLCANRTALTLQAANYLTSSSNSTLSSQNQWVYVSSTCTAGNDGTGMTAYLYRCVRWDPVRAFPSATTDTSPVSVDFTPSSGTTAAQVRTSNTVTIDGVTAPVTLSISGGTGAQFSKNGGAYTSTSTTVTNGDTVTLRATSPVAGVEDTVSLSAGSSSFSWKVRTLANNTIYAFVTSATGTGNLGGVAGADAMCASAATAAGLGGSWLALVAPANTDGNGPASRAPWNWTSLRNMNNAVIATSFNDLVDGTISAPINRTAANILSTATYAWVGASTATGLNASTSGASGNTCSLWSSAAVANTYRGSIHSTTGHFYDGGSVSCAGSYPVYCIQDPGAGLADTNPADVGLVPGVAFSSGAAALSNIITVTAILQPVTVTITPSAGTADIKLNGVSVGTTTTAQPNSTLQFSLTVPAVIGTRNTATITIGDDTYSWWAGYADSTKEAKIFVTSATYDGSGIGGLAGADAKCNTLAAASSLPLSSDWVALLSDSGADAANRIAWNWGTLKNVSGTTIVSGGFPDLWDGSLVAPISKDENGTARSGSVWTGTTSSGARDSTSSGVQAAPWCNNWAYGGASNGGMAGDMTAVSSSWVAAGLSTWCGTTYRLYCFENVSSGTDTTPNNLVIPYAVQVTTSSRQTSSTVLVSGMSSGATQTLSVSATGGNPKFTVNGGAEVSSASVTNGDSLVFKMDAPATGNSSNKMTITAGGMTSYWRVWTGDTTGTLVKRVFVVAGNLATSTNQGGVTGLDSLCQSKATTAGLTGTWKAIVSGTAESDYAVNRIGYDWSTLRRVDGVDVTLYGNLWKTDTIPLLAPISKTQNNTTFSSSYIDANTTVYGLGKLGVSTTAACEGFSMSMTQTAAAYAISNGSSGSTGSSWIDNGTTASSVSSSTHCGTTHLDSVYCIEQ